LNDVAMPFDNQEEDCQFQDSTSKSLQKIELIDDRLDNVCVLASNYGYSSDHVSNSSSDMKGFKSMIQIHST
jgi:hypothetical protein